RSAMKGSNTGLHRQQPGERDLRRSRTLLVLECSYQIHESLIRFTILLLEARNSAAKIGAVELGLRRDLTSQKALTQRTEWNKSDPKFLKRWNDLAFRFPPEQ